MKLLKIVIASLLLMLLITCTTIREIPSYIYIYPVIIEPEERIHPVEPYVKTKTVKKYKDYVLISTKDLNLLGIYKIEMEEYSRKLLHDIEYYAKIVKSWEKGENFENIKN